MPHPDNDRWKCTMFTNKIYLSVCSCDKISLVNNIYKMKQYNMMVYGVVIIMIMIVMCENDMYVHSELHGSVRLAIKFNFSP